MRIKINSSVCAAIGELYKRGACGMEIMDFIVCKTMETSIERKIVNLQNKLVRARSYTAEVATALKMEQREIDAFDV